MARPAFGYRNAAGKKIPGVTTALKAINVGADSDVLIDWGVKLERQGKKWRDVRDAAGSHGTYLHEMCELHLTKGTTPPCPLGVGEEQYQQLLASYRAIEAWWQREKPELLMAEEPLVSEKYQFGGTLDGLATIWGAPWLFDIKSGSWMGVKEIVQMAAYRELLTECKGIRPHGAVLLHAPTKSPGYMRPIRITDADLDHGWQLFLHALDVAKLSRKLKEVCE